MNSAPHGPIFRFLNRSVASAVLWSTVLWGTVLWPGPGLIPPVAYAQHPPSEVLVIGSVHAPRAFFWAPGYTPGHVRAALDKFGPTMVGVESNPLWLGHGHFASNTYEAQYSAVPWAVEHGVPVFGIDWQDLEGLARFSRVGLEQRREWSPDDAETLAARQETAARLAAMLDASIATVEGDPDDLHADDVFNWYNSTDFAETTREWWESEGRSDPAGPEAGHRRFMLLNPRDGHIVEQILVLLRRYPGCRLAVVIGKSHKPNLDRKLALHSDIRVVQLDELGAITPEEAEAAWRPLDALAALRESLDGVGYYFNPEGVDRERVTRLIARLEDAGIDTPEVAYFRARREVLEGRYEEARQLLETLASGDHGDFSYRITVDWNLSIAQMARIALGQVYDLQGERARAVEVYGTLLRELERAAPAIPPEEAFRDLAEWVTDAREPFWTVFSNQTARGVLHTLLREPYAGPDP